MRAVVAFFLFVWLAPFYQKATDGFTILAISSPARPYHVEWSIPPLTAKEEEEVAVALSQRYHYYGCGGQAFVCFSEDGNYVLKFFKQRLFAYPKWLDYIPVPYVLNRYKEKKRAKRKDKLSRDFASYSYAARELKDITEILYLHLNRSTSLNLKPLYVTDRLQITHQIDLDKFDFLIQRKAIRVHDYIHAAMQTGNIEKAERAVTEILSLIAKRCNGGFEDRDPNIATNCGFVGDKAIKIDLGRFIKNNSFADAKNFEQELSTITAPFQQWLKENYPSLINHFNAEYTQMTSKLTLRT